MFIATDINMSFIVLNSVFVQSQRYIVCASSIIIDNNNNKSSNIYNIHNSNNNSRDNHKR
jgi:hypothetical protein